MYGRYEGTVVTRVLVAFNSRFIGGCPYVRQIPRISPPRKIWIFAQSRPGNPGQKHFGSGSLFFASSSSEVGRPTQETVTLTTPPAPAAGATAARQPLQRYPGFRPRPDTPGRLPDRRRPGPEPQPGRAGHRGRRASLRAFPAGFRPRSPRPAAAAGRRQQGARQPARPGLWDPGRLRAARRARRRPARARPAGPNMRLRAQAAPNRPDSGVSWAASRRPGPAGPDPSRQNPRPGPTGRTDRWAGGAGGAAGLAGRRGRRPESVLMGGADERALPRS